MPPEYESWASKVRMEIKAKEELQIATNTSNFNDATKSALKMVMNTIENGFEK